MDTRSRPERIGAKESPNMATMTGEALRREAISSSRISS